MEGTVVPNVDIAWDFSKSASSRRFSCSIPALDLGFSGVRDRAAPFHEVSVSFAIQLVVSGTSEGDREPDTFATAAAVKVGSHGADGATGVDLAVTLEVVRAGGRGPLMTVADIVAVSSINQTVDRGMFVSTGVVEGPGEPSSLVGLLGVGLVILRTHKQGSQVYSTPALGGHKEKALTPCVLGFRVLFLGGAVSADDEICKSRDAPLPYKGQIFRKYLPSLTGTFNITILRDI